MQAAKEHPTACSQDALNVSRRPLPASHASKVSTKNVAQRGLLPRALRSAGACNGERRDIDTHYLKGELPWNSVSHALLAPLMINGLGLDGNRAERLALPKRS